MRFLFVDAIDELSELGIKGRRHFPAAEPLQYAMHTGEARVAPAAISEAIGQLASWYGLARNDFQGRQVFLWAERIDILGPVRPGTTLTLDVVVHTMDKESFRYSGTAAVDGVVVQRMANCSGYFVPLGELEDPDAARARFRALREGGQVLAGHEGAPFAFSALAGEELSLDKGKSVRRRHVFPAASPFFPDHFPRFPVTPIVMLNEMIGQVTATLLGLSDTRRLSVSAVDNVKIRSFVRPDEPCETLVTLTRRESTATGERLATVAEILKEGKRILRGDYHFDLVR